MIGGSGSITSKLASVYAANTKALSDALSRLSSGKKFQSAKDDLSGFIRSNKISTEIDGYRRVREDLTAFKAYTSAAVETGSKVYENLTRMKTLAKQYAGVTDTEMKSNYRAEFESLKIQTGKILTSTFVDDTNIMQASSTITSVPLDPHGGGSLEMKFSTVTEKNSIDGFAIDGESIGTDIDKEIDKMLDFLSEAKAFDRISSQQLKLNETIISSKEALQSLISNIDDASEMSKVIDLSVRQEASIAMIAQGNMMQSSLSMLYDKSENEID